MGPYTQSCHEVVAALNDVGALKVVNAVDGDRNNKASKGADNTHATPNTTSNGTLADSVAEWLTYPEQAKLAGQKGQQLVTTKSNAMQQQLAMIEVW